MVPRIKEMITILKKVLLVKQILHFSSLGNGKRTVWRICILMLRFIRLIGLRLSIVGEIFRIS